MYIYIYILYIYIYIYPFFPILKEKGIVQLKIYKKLKYTLISEIMMIDRQIDLHIIHIHAK